MERQVAKAMAPVVRQVTDMHARLDAFKPKADDIKAARDAQREAERHLPPPLGWVRDSASGDIRRRTTQDLAAANHAAFGRDPNGRRPGEPGYGVAGPLVPHAASPSDLQANADAFWGRKS